MISKFKKLTLFLVISRFFLGPLPLTAQELGSSDSVVTTDEEKTYTQEAARMLAFMDDMVSQQDKELLLYGLASANFRGRTAVLTNDAELASQFDASAGFIHNKDACPKNTLTLYGKFGNRTFTKIEYVRKGNTAGR